MEPVVHSHVAIALLVHDFAGRGTITQAAVGGHECVPRILRITPLSLALAVALVVPEKIPGALHRGEPRFLQKRSGRVGKTVAVLNPPATPTASFHEGIPLRLVERRQIRHDRVGIEEGE